MPRHIQFEWTSIRFAVPLALACASTAGLAVPNVNDAVGDFLPSLLGNRSHADLDVVDASVIYNTANNTFTLISTQAAAVGLDNGTFLGARHYFWGADTGSGIAQFANFGITGIYFNTRIQLILGPGSGLGVGSVGDAFLPYGSITYSGHVISTTFSASLLPSTGYQPGKYLWSLWTTEFVSGGNPGTAFGQYADFAPNNASFTAA